MRKNIYRIVLTLAIVALPTGKAWGNQTTYYAKMQTRLSSLSPVGSGYAYVGSSGTATEETNNNNSAGSSANVNFTVRAVTNTGYQFLGWSASNGSTTYFSTSATATRQISASSTNQGSPTTQTVYAVFDHGRYTVQFNGGGGSGSMSNQQFTHGTPQNLTANAFSKTATVNYNTCGGSAIPPATPAATFKNWDSTHGNPPYANEASLDLTVAHNTTVTMTARWSATVTLPTPTKNVGGISRTFLGWYTAENGGDKIGDAGAVVTVDDGATLYAHWNEFNIRINVSSSDFATGDKAIFKVYKTDSPTITYSVPIDISASSSVVIKGVPAGTYTIEPEGWSWNYTCAPANYTSQTVNEDKTYSFTLTSKNSATSHDEKSQRNWGL